MSYEIVPYGKGKSKGSIEDPSKKIVRRTVDYGSIVVRWMQDCLVRRLPQHRLQCHYSYTKELAPPFMTPQSPYDSICCRFVHASTTKNRAPVNVVHWFPNGRRLLSGTQTGEIIIWNGFQFHFENILQAHNAAVRAMEWTPEETVLVSGDQLGIIKFWDQYLYNFQSFQAHKESICDISVSPTGLKFCSCADDSHAKVWDLRTGEEERAFTGHGWDVKCCAWHPTKGLVATGSKDSQIKLWDPRASEAITTIFCHKNTVTRVKWSPNGQWLASGSRDQLVMLMDIRTMSVRKVFKAHQKEVTSLCWHPESDALLASGGYDSHMHFWDAHGASTPLESVLGAHDGPIWCLAWNPLGHLLVSGSHDYSTRFWSRARPGDTNFTEILPKKVGPAAAEAAAIAAASLPPTPLSQAVFEAGIFAGACLPAWTEEELKAEADKRANVQMKAIEAPLKPSMSGLSLGEGEEAKTVLDTSDFDAEEAAVTPASTATAAPVVPGKAPAKALAPAVTATPAPVAKATADKEPVLQRPPGMPAMMPPQAAKEAVQAPAVPTSKATAVPPAATETTGDAAETRSTTPALAPALPVSEAAAKPSAVDTTVAEIPAAETDAAVQPAAAAEPAKAVEPPQEANTAAAAETSTPVSESANAAPTPAEPTALSTEPSESAAVQEKASESAPTNAAGTAAPASSNDSSLDAMLSFAVNEVVSDTVGSDGKRSAEGATEESEAKRART